MGWNVIGQSAIGMSHAKHGTPCQDSFRFSSNFKGVVASVSDGAGSAKHSEIGSGIATTVMNAHLVAWLNNIWLQLRPVRAEHALKVFQEGVKKVKAALDREAGRMDVPVRDLACTLLACVATKDWLCAMQIGDGLCVYRKPGDDTYSLLFNPSKGEYINETDFVTSVDSLEVSQFTMLRGQTGFLCLSTDGIEKVAVKLSDWSPHAPFFKPFDECIGPGADLKGGKAFLEDFLNSDRLNAKTDDDKTMVIARYNHLTFPWP